MAIEAILAGSRMGVNNNHSLPCALECIRIIESSSLSTAPSTKLLESDEYYSRAVSARKKNIT